MYENLTLEKKDGAAILTINRPKVLNALNRATVLEIDAAFRALADDAEVGVVILTGAEKAFVAGADIAEMIGMSALQARDWARLGQAVLSRIEYFPRPVIAALNGFVLGGGCELAMACDMRIASAKAKMGQPEVNLGICPGFGGTQRLARLAGKGAAKLMCFTADLVDAEEAYRLGLVDKVVPHEELMPTVMAIAAKILTKSAVAVSQCKIAINNGVEMDLEDALSFEAEAFGLCFSHPEQREGMGAFLEKRAPVFKS